MKKNVVLADCVNDEIKDFVSGLESSSMKDFDVLTKISNWGRHTAADDLKRYLVYFFFPMEIFLRRKEFDVIIGWQQFYTLVFVFFCELFHVKKTFRVFAVNYTYKEKKGIIGKIYYLFMRKVSASSYLEKMFVLSANYVEYCSKKLSVNKSKFSVLPFGVRDLYTKYKDIPQGDFALAIGRSNRDYDWLISEWEDIEMPLIIISDTYKRDSIPSNVSIISDVSGDEQYPYIMACRLMIIPISDGTICSGDTVLLTSFSFKKNVIVTIPSTLAEMYIKNNQNGLVTSKEHGFLNECIQKLTTENLNFGEKARESYVRFFSQFRMGMNVGERI